MTRITNKKWQALVTLFASTAFILIHVCPAMAGEKAPDWRPTYDLIMMWVNFLILFGVLYKFLKDPLLDFLRGKKYELEKEMKKAEDQKQEAEAKIKESMRMLEEGKARFESIKERIVAQGEKNKEKIIEEAKEQSQFMLIEAKRKADSQIVRARESFRQELVDMAFDTVLEKLPKEITPEDDERIVQNYLSAIPG